MNLRSQNKIKLEGGMSTMTDLVFLLLIFFIILSALAKPSEDVDLPSGGTFKPGEKAALAVVKITPDNTIFLNGKVILLNQLEEGLNKAVESDTGRRVELHGDKTCDFGVSMDVIGIAKKNRMKVAIMMKK